MEQEKDQDFSREEMFALAQQLREEFGRLLMEYRFGIQEICTKIDILREEFLEFHNYNPIEHISSRLKSPESLMQKVLRKGIEPTADNVRANIHDIAGVRITCSFVSDVYRLVEMMAAQDDVRVLNIKDYIANPKPNGYKSVHLIVEVPVFLSSGAVPVVVEIQIRTIAMDFWASLEHKIFYKYNKEVPLHLREELTEVATVAAELDRKMEHLYEEIHGSAKTDPEDFSSRLNTETVQELLQLVRSRAGNPQEKWESNGH